MSTTLEDFADIQERIVAELQSKGSLTPVRECILAGDPKALEAEIDNMVAGLKGLLILVEPPTGTNSKPAVFGRLIFDQVQLTISCAENTLLNRSDAGTQVTALQAVLEVARALHGYRPAGCDTMLQVLGWSPAEDPALAVYRLTLRTSVTLQSNADLTER